MDNVSLAPHEKAFLLQFKRVSEGVIPSADLKAKSKPKKKGGIGGEPPDQAGMDGLITSLLGRGLLDTVAPGKEGPHPRNGARYRLTGQGKASLTPQRPEISEELSRAQEAFILMQAFRSREHTLTRSELDGKLTTRAAVAQLEFDVEGTPDTVDYHLCRLVEKKCLIEHWSGRSWRYTLDPTHGLAALGNARQHDAVSFTLTGETLNKLLTAMARIPVESQDSSVIDTPNPLAISSPELQLGRHERHASPSESLSPELIRTYIHQLETGAYAGKGLIPIYEVRRIVAETDGAEAASHPVFDVLLERMRSEGLLELLAISDMRDATPEQISHSILGMNETLFYIERR